MLPYTSPFGLRNSIGTVPGSLLMGFPQHTVPALLNSNQMSLNPNNNFVNKDSQWLTLEVCREYQRGLCPRSDLECKYAHPPPYLETLSGRVVCCYDSIKGKCHRVKPPCKYFHPPQHLKDILIQNGKNNLLMKNLQMNMIQQQLSSLTGTPQPRLGLIPVSPKFIGENEKLATTEFVVSSSSCDFPYYNYLNVSNATSNSEVLIPTECETTQCLSNPVSSVTINLVPVTAPVTMPCLDFCAGKKRSLTQMYNSEWSSETVLKQLPDDPVPFKRPVFSETLPGFVMNRDQQINTMGYLMNPFMNYQNSLATYLALNNQTNLQCNALNMSAIATNVQQFPPITPGFICQSPPIGVNNLSLMANLQNQQHLAMILNAANSYQGNRPFSEFSTFK